MTACPDPDRNTRRPRPWLRRAWALWLLLIVVLGVKSGLNPKRHSVYPLFVAGARHWWAGQSLYAEYPGVIDVFEVFRYSPTCAVAFTPLALLPDRLGAILWNVVNLGILAWGVWLAARDVFPGRWTAARLALLLSLVLVGTIRSAWNGQSNPLVIGMLLLAASAVARGRGWTAAALLAATVYLKVSPIAVAMLFVALRPRLLMGRFAVAMIAGAALPFLTRTAAGVAEQYHTWFFLLKGSTSTRWPAFRDAWTVWELTGYAVHVPVYRALQAAAGLATLAWCLHLQRRLVDPRAVLTGALAMGSAYLMVFGPSVEYATYVFLAPAVSWGVLRAAERRSALVWALMAYAMTMVLGTELFAPPLMGRFPIVKALLPGGTLLYAGWLATRAFRPGDDGVSGFALDPRESSRHDAAARRDASPLQIHTPLARQPEL